MSEKEKLSRRRYLELTGGVAAGLILGGALGYVAKPEVTAPPTTVTSTVTETKTVTGTVTAPQTAAPAVRYFNGAKVSTAAIQPFYISPIWTEEGGKTKICTDFEKEHGIDTSWMSGGEDVMREKIALDVSSGTGLYDIIVHEWLLIPPYSTAGWLEPLEPFVKDPDPEYFTTLDDWLPAWVDSCKYEGVLYGIPTYGSGGGYTFNKDYLERYGGWDKPPDSFEELNACCADLKDGFKKAGKEKEIYPMVMQCKKGEEPSNNIVGVAWAYGGRMFEGGVSTAKEIKEKKAKPTLNTPEWEAAFEEYLLLGKPGANAPPGHADYSWYEDYRDMASGTAAINLLASSPLWYLLGDAKKGGKVPPENLSVTIGPKGPTGDRHQFLWNVCHSITTSSKNKKAAWEALQLMISPQNIWGMVDIGVWSFGIPKIMESEEMQRRASAPYGGKVPTMEDLKAMSYSISIAEPTSMPKMPEWPELALELGNNVSAVISGLKTPKKAVDDLQEAVMKIMTRAGYYA